MIMKSNLFSCPDYRHAEILSLIFILSLTIQHSTKNYDSFEWNLDTHILVYRPKKRSNSTGIPRSGLETGRTIMRITYPHHT